MCYTNLVLSDDQRQGKLIFPDGTGTDFRETKEEICRDIKDAVEREVILRNSENYHNLLQQLEDARCIPLTDSMSKTLMVVTIVTFTTPVPEALVLHLYRRFTKP